MGLVVIVDDDDISLKILMDALTKISPTMRISGFTDPSEALTFVKTHDVDLVVTDNMMPVINGVELLKEVKKINKNIKVILMSSFITTDRFIDAKHYDVDAILRKPFYDMKEIVGIIHRFSKKI